MYRCMLHCNYEKLGVKKTSSYIVSPTNAYWGDKLHKSNLQKFKSHKLIKEKYSSIKDLNLKHTAKALASGNIIFSFMAGWNLVKEH